MNRLRIFFTGFSVITAIWFDFCFQTENQTKAKQYDVYVLRFIISLYVSYFQCDSNFSKQTVLLISAQFTFCVFVCYSIGNIYKMSRNKDRYDSNSQRRQQVFMSQEDVAAGRKTNWTGVEITGTLPF